MVLICGTCHGYVGDCGTFQRSFDTCGAIALACLAQAAATLRLHQAKTREAVLSISEVDRPASNLRPSTRGSSCCCGGVVAVVAAAVVVVVAEG